MLSIFSRNLPLDELNILFISLFTLSLVIFLIKSIINSIDALLNFFNIFSLRFKLLKYSNEIIYGKFPKYSLILSLFRKHNIITLKLIFIFLSILIKL